MNWRNLFLAAAAACSLASCASPSPATRIERRPDIYATLPASHQDLARQGLLCNGMSRDAVWIAWGDPNRRFLGEERSHALEIWRYTGLQAVYTNRLNFGVGTTYVRHGGHGHGRSHTHVYSEPFWGYDFGPDYIPYTAAEVKFANGKVAAWERVAN